MGNLIGLSLMSVVMPCLAIMMGVTVYNIYYIGKCVAEDGDVVGVILCILGGIVIACMTVGLCALSWYTRMQLGLVI